MSSRSRTMILPDGGDAGAADPRVGQLLDGRYRIESVLGQGGMGLVYRARHEVLGKAIAVKVLRPEVSRNEQVIERFRREAQAASAIGSPHICDVSDFGTLPDGSTYFVMEFLDGPSLTKAIEDERPMNPRRVVHIARQLCDALGAAHAAGIVHRDLKPDNVHLVRKGRSHDFVKVLDFGIAKVAGGSDKKLTQAGQVFGTPHYMSPEQCAGREVDQRTDVYALGVMLYEMLAGKVPFDAEDLMALLGKHVYDEASPIRAHVPSVPEELEAVVLRCLAKRVEDRYPSMAALHEDLDAFARGSMPDLLTKSAERSVDDSAPALPAIAAPTTDGRSRGASPKWLLLALVGVVVLGGVGTAAAIAFLGGGDTGSGDAGDPIPPIDPEPIPIPPPLADAGSDSGPAPRRDAALELAPSIVRLETDPPRAEVFAPDGVLLGNTPLDLPRPQAGEPPITYRITLAGYLERTFPVGARTAASVSLELARERRRAGTPTPTAPTPDPPPTREPTPDPTPPPRRPDPVDDPLINPF